MADCATARDGNTLNVSAIKHNDCRKTDPEISGNVHLVLSKCIKFPDAPDPAGRAYSAPPDPAHYRTITSSAVYGAYGHHLSVVCGSIKSYDARVSE